MWEHTASVRQGKAYLTYITNTNISAAIMYRRVLSMTAGRKESSRIVLRTRTYGGWRLMLGVPMMQRAWVCVCVCACARS